jgi:hypothetical protein
MAFALVTWARGDGVAWLVGAVLIGTVVPFTVLVMGSTNRALGDGGLVLDAAAALLRRWARLHVVRTVLAVAALVIFIACRA